MKWIALIIAIFVFAATGNAQRVGIGTTTPDSSALLDVKSTNKGVLIPRMSTAQRKAIVDPEESLMVFDTTSKSYWYYDDGWRMLVSNMMVSDSAFLIGKQAGSIPEYNMTTSQIITDSSVYIYDSGGPGGNYGNNENVNFLLNVANSTETLARVQIVSNNLENLYDSLRITTAYGNYLYLGNQTDTLFILGAFNIYFKSNHLVTMPGFVIRIDGLFDYAPDQAPQPPLTGFYFIPEKKALMGGFNLNNAWSADSVGNYSFNYGFGNRARGNNAATLGYDNSATGQNAFVSGYKCVGSGDFSTAMGIQSQATNYGSFALGASVKASGYYAIALGASSLASADHSTAIGVATTASGMDGSLASGLYSKARGSISSAFNAFTVSRADHSSSFGQYTKAKSFCGMVVGSYNDSIDVAGYSSLNANTRLFQVGNGSAENARSNAMTVLYSGSVGIGITAPLSRLHVRNGGLLIDGAVGSTPISGAGTRLMWVPAKKALRAGEVPGNRWDNDSIGNYSLAFGYNCIAKEIFSFAYGSDARAKGNGAIAMGGNALASGFLSLSIGENTKASGSHAIAMGQTTTASGILSVALGNFSKASGGFSTAMGSNTMSKSYYGTVIGSYNDSTNAANPNDFNLANRIFQIGIGSNNTSRSNAMTVLQSGNVGIGTTTPSLLLQVSRGTNYSVGNTYAISATDNSNNNLRLNLGYDAAIDAAVIQASQEGFSFNKKLLLNPNAGNVGIGITSPNNILDVGGRVRVRYGAGNTAGIYFNKNDNTTETGFIGTYSDDNYIGLYGHNGAGWAFLMNTTNGNIGLGAAVPSEKLHVIGNGLFTGSVTASCGVLVCSDIRYKKNILPVTNALNSLQSIHGIYYNWDNQKFADKNFGDERQIGFSAQELEKVYPEMVKTDANGFKTVDYSRLTPVLVEAIKEQQTTIEELRENHKIQETYMKEQGLQISALQIHAEDQKRIIEIMMKEIEAIKLSLK